LCIYSPIICKYSPERIGGGEGRGGREERIPRALPPEEKRRKTRQLAQTDFYPTVLRADLKAFGVGSCD
jgi:hypothetical protein